MKRVPCLLCLMFSLLAQGCSGDALLRGAYESLQDLRQMTCYKAMGADCGRRESFDDYSRRLRELEPEPVSALDPSLREAPVLVTQ